MYPHLLKIQIAIACLVAIGGFVLGVNLRASDLAAVSIIGAVVAFIIVDRLKWFELYGWLANIVLIGILFFSMRDFIGGNSTEKLRSVANLLAFMQVALAFQKKTPRLCWQLLVMSILQVVVAAIFNLNFEHGAYFILYFAVVTVTMSLQNDFGNWTRLHRQNEAGQANAREQSKVTLTAHPATLGKPIAISRTTENRRMVNAWQLLVPWMVVSTVFAFLLYHSLPRSPQEWDDASVRNFIGTGKSKQVKLDYDGNVPLSNALVFRAKFHERESGKQITLNRLPYFRGMAFSRFTLANNITSWEAPYDHVFNNWSYQKLKRYSSSTALPSKAKPVEIEIVTEPTSDPLLHAPAPTYRRFGGESDIEFCRELSALTRRRDNVTNTIASYIFKVTTFVDKTNIPLEGWPYQPFTFGNAFPELETGSPEYHLLTAMEPERYPQLVQIANNIAADNDRENRLQICNAILNHFGPTNRYSYTLDYGDVERDESLDPVEDFVANHRTGHCELYASAMVLMLRSLGIPARYVIGFHGGEYNSLTKCYMIRGHHAHAWVETYVPPESCTQDMFDRGVAGPGGAWITMDPTPAVDLGETYEAIDLARTIWQDYVISPDQNKQNFNGDNLLMSSRTTDLGRMYDHFVEETEKRPAVQLGLMGFGGLFLLVLVIRSRRKRKTDKTRTDRPIAAVRRFLARAASVISPELGRFIVGNDSSVPFYRNLERLLAKHYKLERSASQTQLEFVSQAVESISHQVDDPVEGDKIGNIMKSVTAAFYQQRFGTTALDSKTISDIENQIKHLEVIIKSS